MGADDAKNWGPGSGMPVFGILTVTVPGTVWGWDAIEKRFGKLGFRETLQAAADYAENGFPVSQRIAHDWRLPKALPLEHCCTTLDPNSVAAWYIDGKPPVPGQIYRNPDLAKALRLLQAEGADAFYRGAIAKAIVAKSSAVGGTMTFDDLASYKGEWQEPAHSVYHGHDIYELPPPSQAWAALEMLNVLEACVPRWVPGQTLASLGPRSPEYWHLLVEAKKLAYSDLIAVNGDPDVVKIPLDMLLSKSHAEQLCGRVDPAHASPTGRPGEVAANGDTIVLSTADAEGNVVAWVNSNYAPFGSGLTVPGYGFILHDRGALFSLDPASPNLIAPHKPPDGDRHGAFPSQPGLEPADARARAQRHAGVGARRDGPSAYPALERQGRRLSGDLYRAPGGTGDIADLSRRLRPSQGWSSSRLVGSGATSLRRLAEALNARTS